MGDFDNRLAAAIDRWLALPETQQATILDLLERVIDLAEAT